MPRARIVEEDGRASEWRSRALPRYQRLTRKAEALIASVYLSGTNTRRVNRALFGLFRGAVSKDVVSRAWRKVKVDWDAWCSRGLAQVLRRVPDRYLRDAAPRETPVDITVDANARLRVAPRFATNEQWPERTKK